MSQLEHPPQDTWAASNKGSRILTGHHPGGNGGAEDVTDDCIDADIVGNTWLQIRNGDAAPVPRHPLLELGAPWHGRLVGHHVLSGRPGAVPGQLDGAVADPCHPQVLRGRHWWEGQRYGECQGGPGLFFHSCGRLCRSADGPRGQTGGYVLAVIV